MNADPAEPADRPAPPAPAWPSDAHVLAHACKAPGWRADAVLHLLMGRRDPARMARMRADVAGHPALAGRRLVWHVPARTSDTPAEAARAAEGAAADGGVVLAIGGDGTINAAAQACWQRGVPMGVVCQGTFNYFSRQQGIAPELAEAVAQFSGALDSGLARPVLPGTVNGQAFLVNASLGLYPRLLADREAATRQFGRHRVVAVVAGLLSLLRTQRGQVLRLRERDEQGRERQRMTLASTLFIGNNALQLQRVGVDEAEKAGRRRLVATTLAPRPLRSMLALIWRAARGRLGEHEAVDSFSCTALTVEAAGWRLSDRVRVAFDGERSWMRLPLRFAVADTPLWLVAPHPAPQPLPHAAQAGEAVGSGHAVAGVAAAAVPDRGTPAWGRGVTRA